MLEPNPKPWIAMVNSCCRNGKHKEALWQFTENVRCSFSCKNDYQVFGDVLKSSAALSDIRTGRVLHSYVVKLGHFYCQAVSKSLLNMYAKCGFIYDSQNLFEQMDRSDPVVWNIVLSGLAGSRVYESEVIRLFNRMRLAEGPKPSPVTFAIVLPVCARQGDAYSGKSVHSYLVKCGLDTDTLVGNALVSMYAKCGLVDDEAYAAFDSIGDKDVVSWNAIIAGFSENKMMDDAFRLFILMLNGPTEPNYATIVNIMPVCASLDKADAILFGREIHGYVWRRTELASNVSVCNSLVSFYLRVGWTEEAVSLFRGMKLRDLVSWNALIVGYATNNSFSEALNLFRELICAENICPDSVTFVSVLPACAQLKNLQVGKEIHGYLLRHLCQYNDTSVGNALVNFYAKSDAFESAKNTFLMIPRKDLISWNSVLDAFVGNQCQAQFLDLLHWMFTEGNSPDCITVLTIIRFFANIMKVEKVKETHTYVVKTNLLLNNAKPSIGNALLDAYAKCGNTEYALKIFRCLSGKKDLIMYDSIIPGYVNSRDHEFPRDLTTWNLMVRVYVENHCADEAISLFHELQSRGMKPDAVTITSLLPVCAQIASLHLLRQCHAFITRAGFEDVPLKGTLLDVYAKSGNVNGAYKLFQSDPEKDLVMFTAMIGGYAIHGMGKEALMVFDNMLELNMKPDHVIITTLLSACSHAGLVDDGLKIFYSIEEVHAMKPTVEQYACAVDLLARRGRLSDAYDLVAGMNVEANANIWGTLLGACRTHHEVELGRVVADRLFEVESNNIGNYVLMSNLYAADCKWDGVMEMRKLMRSRELKKPAGCSWIELEGRQNVFIAGDSSHPLRTVIYTALRTLDQQIKEPLQLPSK